MTWKWRLRSLAARRRIETDLEDEIQSHLEMRAAELRAAGLSEDEARLQARRMFGNATAVRERTRARNINEAFETFLQDVRFGCRLLVKQPGFAFAAIVTLAVAIGANGAIFSAVEAMLLRPMPFPEPSQLVFIWGLDARHQRNSISPIDLDDWRKGKSFRAIAAVQAQSVNLTGIDQPTRVVGTFASPEYFTIFGVEAALGRTFNSKEDEPGAERVTVITHGLWQSRFGGDMAIVGKAITLNGEPYTIIGVLPPSFTAPFFPSEVFLPSHVYPNYTRDRARTCILAFARLAEGASIRAAQAELDGINAQLARAYPATNRDRGAAIMSMHDLQVENLKPTLLALWAAVGCLLLIACANVANLLMSKAAGRRHEMSVRTLLGAGRKRLVRQLLTESLVLAAGGTLFGVAIAYGLSRALAVQFADSWPGGAAAGLNWTVVGFMALLAIGTAVVFGLAPSLNAGRSVSQGARVKGDRRARAIQSALVIAQAALALVLMAGSGLMVESVRRLLNVEVGFDGSRVLTAEYRLPRNKYPNDEQQSRFHEAVVEKLQALPGVESAAVVRGLPFSGNGGQVEVRFADRPDAPPSAPYMARYNAASPSYFDTVHIPLRGGRTFTASDSYSAPRVVIVSDSFIQRYWPGQDAVGRQVLAPSRDRVGGSLDWTPATVVGVVGSVRHDSLDEPDEPQIYVPYAQDPFIFATIVMRTRDNPMAHVRDMQRAVWSIDKDQPMWKIRTLASLVDRSLGPRRMMLSLLGFFSAVALALSALGLYGVLSYRVTQETAELGIRVAIGAAPANILAMVLRRGLALAALGLLCGLAAAPLLARALRSQLFGVGTVDVRMYGLVAALLLAVSALSSLLPARRAMRLDPARALRAE